MTDAKAVDLGAIRNALSHLKAVRRAGPEFDTHERYSFTNTADCYEIERAIEFLACLVKDATENG